MNAKAVFLALACTGDSYVRFWETDVLFRWVAVERFTATSCCLPWRRYISQSVINEFGTTLDYSILHPQNHPHDPF